MKTTEEEIARYRENWLKQRPDIPYGRCWCGCGGLTPIAEQTSRKNGRWVGEPCKWMTGHRAGLGDRLTVEEYRREWQEQAPNIPYGLCRCGCGIPTGIAGQTHAPRRVVKGEPERYLIGHASVRPRKIAVEDRGFTTPCHIWHGAKSAARGRENKYGTMHSGGKIKKAHRVIYEEIKGPIPPNHELHHLCEQTLCVNPEHLQPLTRADHFKTYVESFSALGLEARWGSR